MFLLERNLFFAAAGGRPAPCSRAARLRAGLVPLSCLGGLLLALTLSCMGARLAYTCAAVRADTLRLHIRAASDSVADQNAKLRVRDAVLELTERLYGGAQTAQQAKQTAARCLPRIALCARHALWQQGCRQTVRVFLTNMYFSTSIYNEYTLPAGTYDALRIEIGAGAGQNWWCCLYPQICLAACSGGYDTPEEQRLVVGQYELRLRLAEWWQALTGAAGQAQAVPEGIVCTAGG